MKILHTMTAAAALTLAATPLAMAQQGGQNGQTNAARNQPVNNQRILQEKAAGTGAPLTISPATVRQIQQRLNEAGYNPGAVNGNWDRQTSRALQSWQKAQGLAPTGNLNLTTLLALGVFGNNGGSRYQNASYRQMGRYQSGGVQGSYQSGGMQGGYQSGGMQSGYQGGGMQSGQGNSGLYNNGASSVYSNGSTGGNGLNSNGVNGNGLNGNGSNGLNSSSSGNNGLFNNSGQNQGGQGNQGNNSNNTNTPPRS